MYKIYQSLHENEYFYHWEKPEPVELQIDDIWTTFV